MSRYRGLNTQYRGRRVRLTAGVSELDSMQGSASYTQCKGRRVILNAGVGELDSCRGRRVRLNAGVGELFHLLPQNILYIYLGLYYLTWAHTQ